MGKAGQVDVALQNFIVTNTSKELQWNADWVNNKSPGVLQGPEVPSESSEGKGISCFG